MTVRKEPNIEELSQLTFTKEYRRAINMTDAFKKHIWENGVHRMRSQFDRVSGTGHIYCLSCHELVWEDEEDE